MPTKLIVDCSTGVTTEVELTAEEIAATFPTELDKETYYQNLDLLWKEYFDSKQSIIKMSSSRERKYVEARKLIWLSEYYFE